MESSLYVRTDTTNWDPGNESCTLASAWDLINAVVFARPSSSCAWPCDKKLKTSELGMGLDHSHRGAEAKALGLLVEHPLQIADEGGAPGGHHSGYGADVARQDPVPGKSHRRRTRGGALSRSGQIGEARRLICPVGSTVDDKWFGGDGERSQRHCGGRRGRGRELIRKARLALCEEVLHVGAGDDVAHLLVQHTEFMHVRQAGDHRWSIPLGGLQIEQQLAEGEGVRAHCVAQPVAPTLHRVWEGLVSLRIRGSIDDVHRGLKSPRTGQLRLAEEARLFRSGDYEAAHGDLCGNESEVEGARLEILQKDDGRQHWMRRVEPGHAALEFERTHESHLVQCSNTSIRIRRAISDGERVDPSRILQLLVFHLDELPGAAEDETHIQLEVSPVLLKKVPHAGTDCCLRHGNYTVKRWRPTERRQVARLPARIIATDNAGRSSILRRPLGPGTCRSHVPRAMTRRGQPPPEDTAADGATEV
eukprot:scaffold773_cov114-Isochrysis_galbana.AAC.6